MAIYYKSGMFLKLVTGNGKRGTGNGEWESGNEWSTVTRLRFQNGGGIDFYNQYIL